MSKEGLCISSPGKGSDAGEITYKRTKGNFLAVGDKTFLVFTDSPDAGHAFEGQCRFNIYLVQFFRGSLYGDRPGLNYWSQRGYQSNQPPSWPNSSSYSRAERAVFTFATRADGYSWQCRCLLRGLGCLVRVADLSEFPAFSSAVLALPPWRLASTVKPQRYLYDLITFALLFALRI